MTTFSSNSLPLTTHDRLIRKTEADQKWKRDHQRDDIYIYILNVIIYSFNVIFMHSFAKVLSFKIQHPNKYCNISLTLILIFFFRHAISLQYYLHV